MVLGSRIAQLFNRHCTPLRLFDFPTDHLPDLLERVQRRILPIGLGQKHGFIQALPNPLPFGIGLPKISDKMEESRLTFSSIVVWIPHPSGCYRRRRSRSEE